MMFGVVLALFAATAQAQQPSASKPEEREFTLVAKYAYQVRKYDPPVRVQYLAERPGVLGNPEAVLISMLSAAKNLDYDWWLSCWDTAAQARWTKHYGEGEAARKKFAEEWKGKLADYTPTLNVWIQTGSFILVEYDLSPSPKAGEAPKAAAAKGPLPPGVFRPFSTGWRATLELEKDPVFLHYRSGKTSVEEVIR